MHPLDGKNRTKTFSYFLTYLLFTHPTVFFHPVFHSPCAFFPSLLRSRPGVTHTFQALSEEDLELWLDAMDGKEPMYAHPTRPSDATQTQLDEAGFLFMQRCLAVLEHRGLEDQGLYREEGVPVQLGKTTLHVLLSAACF